MRWRGCFLVLCLALGRHLEIGRIDFRRKERPGLCFWNWAMMEEKVRLIALFILTCKSRSSSMPLAKTWIQFLKFVLSLRAVELEGIAPEIFCPKSKLPS